MLDAVIAEPDAHRTERDPECREREAEQNAPVESAEQAEIRDVTILGANGETVSAWVRRPTDTEPRAGLLFVHWGFGNRESFLLQACAFSSALPLLIDAPGFGARRGPRVPTTDARAARDYAQQFLGDLTHAVDFLCAQPGVDSARIGFVGHSLGATIAPAFLAREPRVRAAVLMAGAGRLSRLWLNARDAEGRAALEAFDGVRCLPEVRARVLFQFAERDEFITRADAEEQLAAAREPKDARWYRCDHALDARAASERASWLAQQLGFADDWQLPDDELLPHSQLRRYRMLKPLLRVASWLTPRG
jgi:dienelactone hydrolase